MARLVAHEATTSTGCSTGRGCERVLEPALYRLEALLQVTLEAGEDRGNGALWQLPGTSSGLNTSSVSVYGPKQYGVSSASGNGETLLG
ncbi:hypothetical protein GCM10010104_24530 [Streptomyces indiaensis]|uniref:Uncharacterized protein n=2 Tax=Streptomyces indiaensis TaxID=284033 RepID=A0ABN3DG78_9ACTN